MDDIDDILDEIVEHVTGLHDDFDNIKKTFKAIDKKIHKINELVKRFHFGDGDDEPEYPDKWYPGLP